MTKLKGMTEEEMRHLAQMALEQATRETADKARLREKVTLEISIYSTNELKADAAIAIVLDEAAKVAESYEPRCDTCPSGAPTAIRNLNKQD